MKRKILEAVVAICIVSEGAWAQAREAVSVEPAAYPVLGYGYSSKVDREEGRTVAFFGASLQRLLAFAYNVGLQQIQGPASLTDQRYDVAITLPFTSTRADIRLALEGALARKFQLVTHVEQDVGRIGKLELVADGPASSNPAGKDDASNSECTALSYGDSATLRCSSASIADISDEMSFVFASYLRGWRITDTGASEKRYDFVLERESHPEGADANDGASLQSELQRQLGVRLMLNKRIVEVLVIDSFDSTVGTNQAGVFRSSDPE
jgi:uncharacterized protein (TIGR03435 family)